jgi:general secretion pathway protein A
LTYAILARKGIVLLTGDAGTGKTTVLSKVLRHLTMQGPGSGGVQSSLILNPTLTPDEFLEMVLADFGFSDIPASKSQRILKLQQFLLDGQAAGKVSVLVVDEAHKLSAEVLEEIRLLSNFEQTNQKLLQIVLAGQNELSQLLERPDLRQFKQRIAVRLELKPLSSEVEQYIQYRWNKAGGQQTAPFEPEAIRGIAQWSHGIPRLINVICDNALLLAFGEEVSRVTFNHVHEICTDFKLADSNGKPASATPIAPAHRSVLAANPLPPPMPTAPMTGLLLTLERYNGVKSRPSLWARWAGRLGLVHLGAD